MEAVRVPDHIDVLATMACGAQMHMVISDVLVGAGRPAVRARPPRRVSHTKA
jgi:hypothetical protein